MNESATDQNNDDVLIIDDSDEVRSHRLPAQNPAVWRMLVVDDDEDMHNVTRLVLSNFQFKDKQLELISAYSGAEAFEILKNTKDIALILLDVVMETDDAGLVLTRRIREELQNHLVRIVLRTGQSGQAPETQVIAEYDINDYKDKSELTVQKLRTAVISGLRAYESLSTLEAVINERKAVDQLKSEFISTVSHELRTPLTSIRGALGLLASGALVALPAQAKNLVDVALRNSERLTALVNDILDVERISSDNLNLNLEQLDLIALANLAMNDNEIYAQQLGIRFIPQVNGVALVNADSNRVQQIFANLMTNSIKFSNKGGEIHVTVMQKTETVRVEIKDFGSGIPVEFQPRIFGRFAQADSADTRQHGGTGLGLNISKALVEKMGGTIGFSSEKDIGTVFWFELPKA